jgi:hypothetical protein
MMFAGGGPMHWLHLLLLSAFVLSPRIAAADLVPLAIQPLSVSVTAGGTTANGTSTATALGPFSDGSGNLGAVTATITIVADRILIELEGVLSVVGTSTPQIGASAEVTFDFVVPDVGDALTPIFIDFSNLAESGTWMPARLRAAGVSSVEGVYSSISSSQLGALVLPEAWPAATYAALEGALVQPLASFVSLPTGHSIRARIGMYFNRSAAVPASTGAFATTAELRLRAPTPTIGTGDVNGDRFVDLLDSTLLRRRLAGVDPWP